MKITGTLALIAFLLLFASAATAQLPPECEFEWVDCSHLEDGNSDEGESGDEPPEEEAPPEADPVDDPVEQTGGLSLPDVASDQGKASSAKGLATANQARQSGGRR
jgi:hypothetical protein